MEGFLRKITIYLCKPIYSLIVYMYKIFYNIATTRFLDTEIVQTLSANIYTLISMIMLFAFSITILSAIVNPDLLNDEKKGVKAAFKRAIIGLMLIIIVPFGFDKLYEIQESVMSNSLIEKIVVGVSYDCPKNSTDKDCAGGNGGQVIVGTLISSVLYPDDTYADSDGNVTVNVSVADYYNKMISEDFVKYVGPVAKNINATATNVQNVDVTDDDAYAFKFDKLVALGAGIATVYILLLFSIDVSVRVFKLAFLELTAPISIVSYIAAGDKILSSWFKELGKTYAELFVRVAAMAFYLFLLHNLNSAMSSFSNSDWSFVLKVFLLVGMLIFAKQVPDMIGRVFGIEMKSQGGIAGRLGSMAGVGNVAKGAWQGLTNLAKTTPLLAGAGIGALAGKGAGLLGNGLSKAGGWLGQTAVGQKVNGNATVQKVKASALNGVSSLKTTTSRAASGVKSATTAVNAAAHESNPFKSYNKLKYSEGSMGSVNKENKEYLKNEQAKKNAKSILSGASTLLDANGEPLLDTNGDKIKILDTNGNVIQGQGVNATTAAYKSMVNQMKWTDQQKDAEIKYNEKQHDLMVAQKDNQVINQIRTAIETKMNASTGTVKADLANVLTGMDLGTISSTYDLGESLGQATNYDTNFVNSILGQTKNLSSINLESVQSYSSNVDAAQEAFSRADSTLNDVINKATSEQKVILKEARTASKNMNEANTK